MTGEEFEILLAEVVDELYLRALPTFCDWENRTHKLGWFKEGVKARVHLEIKKRGM